MFIFLNITQTFFLKHFLIDRIHNNNFWRLGLSVEANKRTSKSLLWFSSFGFVKMPLSNLAEDQGRCTLSTQDFICEMLSPAFLNALKAVRFMNLIFRDSEFSFWKSCFYIKSRVVLKNINSLFRFVLLLGFLKTYFPMRRNSHQTSFKILTDMYHILKLVTIIKISIWIQSWETKGAV